MHLKTSVIVNEARFFQTEKTETVGYAAHVKEMLEKFVRSGTAQE